MAWLSVSVTPIRFSAVPREASWRENMTVALLGAWTVAGLFLDGWAHENLAALETVFTPWHAVLYSGLFATIVVYGWMVARRRLGGLPGREAIPPGYALGLAGLALFAVGGLADLLWHGAFGIERSLDALLSPPHLVMLVGALLALTSPLRAAWLSRQQDDGVPNFWRFLPVVVVAALASAATGFFFMYLSVFTGSDVSDGRVGWSLSAASRLSSQRLGIASIVITNAILFAPVFFLMRRWVLPGGTFLLMFATTAVLLAGVREMAHWHAVVAALAGALLVEILHGTLQPSLGRPQRFRVFAATAPLVFWAVYFSVSHAVRGVVWSAELTFGVWIWTGLSGLALSLLVLPPAMPEPRQSA
ncbi:MAG: hypothetical protein KatS3mg060_1492 [Dehalococcoidia bacterium]|nr:MAG: hypothetical protein KatS3mg060_1492 [Dehalococcoidia bacterium]